MAAVEIEAREAAGRKVGAGVPVRSGATRPRNLASAAECHGDASGNSDYRHSILQIDPTDRTVVFMAELLLASVREEVVQRVADFVFLPAPMVNSDAENRLGI